MREVRRLTQSPTKVRAELICRQPRNQNGIIQRIILPGLVSRVDPPSCRMTFRAQRPLLADDVDEEGHQILGPPEGGDANDQQSGSLAEDE